MKNLIQFKDAFSDSYQVLLYSLGRRLDVDLNVYVEMDMCKL